MLNNNVEIKAGFISRFVYDANTGGVQKTLKPVQFSAELEIPKVYGLNVEI